MADYPPMPNALGQPPNGNPGVAGGFGLGGGAAVPGQASASPTGAPVMLQPGQMPMQGENYQYQSFQHPMMTPPQGMGQGVGQGMGQPNTQFPLNPGMGGPIHGQQVPDGQLGGQPGDHFRQWAQGQNALGGGRDSWRNLPGQGILQMLQQLQTQNPDIFNRIMQSHLAQRFGITADNLGTMESRQQGRHDAMGANPVMTPGGGTSGAPLQPAPVAPPMVTAPTVSQTPVSSYQLPTY